MYSVNYIRLHTTEYSTVYTTLYYTPLYTVLYYPVLEAKLKHLTLYSRHIITLQQTHYTVQYSTGLYSRHITPNTLLHQSSMSGAVHRRGTNRCFTLLLHCTALHCTALQCTALHCTALLCTALHCTALHCN